VTPWKPCLSEVSVATFVHERLLRINRENRDRVITVCGRIERTHKLLNELNHSACHWRLMPESMACLLEILNDLAKTIDQDQSIKQTLVIAPAGEFAALVSDFEKAYGKALASQIPLELHSLFAHDDDKDVERVIDKQIARVILNDLFPKSRPDQHTFINRTTIDECSEFLSKLPRYANNKIDRAIFEVLQRVPDFGTTTRRELAFAHQCVACLVGSPVEPELRIYLQQQREKANNAPPSDDRSYDAVIYGDLLKKLKK